MKQIERDMLFVKEPVAGENIHYSINQEDVFDNYPHIVERKTKFSPGLLGPLGSGAEFNPAFPIHRDDVLWRDNEFVIPLRLLNDFLRLIVR